MLLFGIYTICTLVVHYFVDDKNPAVVITIYETSITCCNSGAFVSAGLFQKFCLRFSDDFDYTAETWKIDDCDFMNTCEFVSIVLWLSEHNPAGISLFRVNNRYTRTMCETCSKLTITTPE